MNRRGVGVRGFGVGSIALLAFFISGGLLTSGTEATERARPVLIGALNASWGPTPQVIGLRDGLSALGYQETVQFVIGVRFTQGDLTALPVTARKLVQDRVDIIFADHDDAAKAAQQATIAAVQPGEVDGILAPRCCALNIPGFVLEATTQRAIPTLFETGFWVERGALASYGPDLYASGWMAARVVDKIIKGVSPAEIPVEVNPKIEFAINLKVAAALRLTLAPEVVYQADRLV